MAFADYHLCHNCGRKAFYDANIRDPHYIATYDPSVKCEPIGIVVLCGDCNKTHKIVIQPRASTEPKP